MEKGDPSSVGALTGYLINELHARLAAPRQRGIEIGDAEADVMDAGAVAGEILPDRAARVGGGEQLDCGVAQGEADDGGTVGDLGRMGHQAEDVAVEADRLVQFPDGNSHVRKARLGGDFRRQHETTF